MRILITGSAGFIGYHLVRKLLEQGVEVCGIDSLNHYYDVSLKKARLRACGIQEIPSESGRISASYPNYRFFSIDLCDKNALEQFFSCHTFDLVVHLAAQAGVRYSLEHPESYIDSNVSGFLNLLECCRQSGRPRLVYASSSSVYGNAQEVPFREDARTDCPQSIYAVTKKANEWMAYTYSSLYRIPTIGLRFFTVYGPWGRPDMAPILFANAIRKGRPIRIFNNGNLSRDFTYIDDIVAGICKIIGKPGAVREDVPGVPSVIYNIGRGSPVRLMDFIGLLEQNIGKKARKLFVGMQAGDVYQTWADTTKLQHDYGYVPATSLEKGIHEFAEWYRSFYD